MDSCEFSMESGKKGEISTSLCSSNKYKLSNKPEQIFKSFSEFCYLVWGQQNKRNFLALCVDMRRDYGCLLSAYFSYVTYLPPPALRVLTGRTEWGGKSPLCGLPHISDQFCFLFFCFFFWFVFVFVFKVGSTPNLGPEVKTLRSRVACCTEWASQSPHLWSVLLFFCDYHSYFSNKEIEALSKVTVSLDSLSIVYHWTLLWVWCFPHPFELWSHPNFLLYRGGALK